MKKSAALVCILFTLWLLSSCGYCYRRLQSEDGKKHWARDYKTNEKAERYQDRTCFKHGKRNGTYQKYAGTILSDTIHHSTYLQYDSVRTYLFHDAAAYKDIFFSGLLYNRLFYCLWDSLCRPPKEPEWNNAVTGEPIVRSLWGWTGPVITIDHFEELHDIKSPPTKRQFKFWVYTEKVRYNGGNAIFLLELTNEQANRHTDLESFIKGARVNFLVHARTMI